MNELVEIFFMQFFDDHVLHYLTKYSIITVITIKFLKIIAELPYQIINFMIDNYSSYVYNFNNYDINF